MKFTVTFITAPVPYVPSPGSMLLVTGLASPNTTGEAESSPVARERDNRERVSDGNRTRDLQGHNLAL